MNKLKLLLKSPTFAVIDEASKYKGCLIPANQSGLFFASDLEQKAIEYGIVKPEQIIRKDEIERILRNGYRSLRIPKPYISENLLNQCYNIIVNGSIFIDVYEPLIINLTTHNAIPDEIRELIEELMQIKIALNYFYEYSADAFLDRMYNYYLISKCIYTRDNKPVFVDVNDVLNGDIGLLKVLTNRFIEFRNYIPECVFRAIARGEGDAGRRWLSKWFACKAINISPFEELDENKSSLIRWTVQYENIKSGYEPPPDDIIENDVELDNWLYNRKIDKNRRSFNKDGIYFENRSNAPAVVEPNAMTFEAG